MDYNQQMIIQLLSHAIHNNTMPETLDVTIDWDAIFEESLAHQVHTLIYPVIKQLLAGPNQTLLRHWQKQAIASATVQIQHIKQISEVIKKFTEEGIQIIALKGLVLREYYPYPDLRNMGDADILVQSKDINHAKALLKILGYEEHHTTIKHCSFTHTLYPEIELHWTLSNEKLFPKTEHFCDEVWSTAISTSICYTPVLTMAPDYQILHLLLHMAEHMKCGFGLRQLCDFVLFMEANNEIIHWSFVQEKANHYGIYRFTCAVFLLCNKLFQIDIPSLFINQGMENDDYFELLQKDIFEGGIFGYRVQERIECSTLLNYVDDVISLSFKQKLARIIHILMPPANKLPNRFHYALKFPGLLPLAWLHRIIDNIVRKGFLSCIKVTYKVNDDYTVNRTKLLKWLGLK